MGNKMDLESTGEIEETTAQSFASAHKFELHYKTSCKTNDGISEAFSKLARALHKPDSILTEPRKQNTDDIVDITARPSPSESTGSCKC